MVPESTEKHEIVASVNVRESSLSDEGSFRARCQILEMRSLVTAAAVGFVRSCSENTTRNVEFTESRYLQNMHRYDYPNNSIRIFH